MGLAFYLHFIYSLPSIILYCLILYVILRDRKEMKGPYYTILRFSFGLDVTSYLTNFIAVWLFSFTFLSDWFMSMTPFQITLLLYFNKLCLHAQNFRCIFSCLHRFTIIACPLRTEIFWEKYIFWILCFVPIYGSIVAIYSLFMDPWFTLVNGQVYWEFRCSAVLVYPTILLVAFYIAFTAVPNVMTMRMLVKHRREAIAERICYATWCCGFLQFCNLLSMLAIGLAQANDKRELAQFLEMNMLPFTRDFYSFSYPWFNFALNRDVRRKVLAILHLGSSKVADHSSVSSTIGVSEKKKTIQLQTLSTTNSSSRVQFTLDTIDMEKDL